MKEQTYCARHDTWHDTTVHCPHCATAALINELRQTIGTLEARLSDAAEQARQDRWRITQLEHVIRTPATRLHPE